MRLINSPLVFMFLFAMLSCHKTDEVPDSLNEILMRNGYNELVNGSNGGGNSIGGTGIKYNLLYGNEVKDLLSKTTGWNDVSPPDCEVGQCQSLTCIRDTYVCAAVTYAWAAEMEFRRGNTQTAKDHAQAMYNQLLNAKNLCGSGSTVQSPCNNYCLTGRIYPC